jgi:hypothetical protein
MSPVIAVLKFPMALHAGRSSRQSRPKEETAKLLKMVLFGAP